MNPMQTFIMETGRTPVVPLAGFPGAPLAGVSIRQALFDAQVQIKALRALYEAIQPDAVFTMMDLTVEPEFYGCDLKVTENAPPAVIGHNLKDENQFEEMFAGKTTGGRMDIFAEAVRGLKDSLDVPVGAYVIGPFTLAAELLGIAPAMKTIKKNPDYLKRVLEKTTVAVAHYIRLLEDAGADMICILEPSAMMISPQHFRDFSQPYCKQLIAESIKGMSILHICGNTNHLLAEMEAAGPHALSLDKQVDFVEARKKLNNETVLIGNIDPVSLATCRNPEEIREKSLRLCEALGGESNYILSTGCDIPENALIDNLKAMTSVR